MTLGLEINDAGLVLAADGELLAEEPGVAMLDGTDVAPGSWHLAAARSITAAACRGGRGTSASHGTGSG